MLETGVIQLSSPVLSSCRTKVRPVQVDSSNMAEQQPCLRPPPHAYPIQTLWRVHCVQARVSTFLSLSQRVSHGRHTSVMMSLQPPTGRRTPAEWEQGWVENSSLTSWDSQQPLSDSLVHTAWDLNCFLTLLQIFSSDDRSQVKTCQIQSVFTAAVSSHIWVFTCWSHQKATELLQQKLMYTLSCRCGVTGVLVFNSLRLW